MKSFAHSYNHAILLFLLFFYLISFLQKSNCHNESDVPSSNQLEEVALCHFSFVLSFSLEWISCSCVFWYVCHCYVWNVEPLLSQWLFLCKDFTIDASVSFDFCQSVELSVCWGLFVIPIQFMLSMGYLVWKLCLL